MTASSMPKTIYTNEIIYHGGQMKAANIYRAPIYMYARLGLGLYGLYICIYTDLEAFTQSGADVYIYICLPFGVQG